MFNLNLIKNGFLHFFRRCRRWFRYRRLHKQRNINCVRVNGMIIDKATIDYFKTVRRYDTDQQLKEQIGSWLELLYHRYGIDYQDVIYNKEKLIEEFYKQITND